MTGQELFIVIITLQISGAIVVVGTAFLTWRRRNVPGAISLLLLMVTVVSWVTSLVARWFAGEPAILFCMASAAMNYLVFVLEYAQQDRLLVKKNILLLWLIPLLTFNLAFKK